MRRIVQRLKPIIGRKTFDGNTLLSCMQAYSLIHQVQADAGRYVLKTRFVIV
jgi:hypothetical protein